MCFFGAVSYPDTRPERLKAYGFKVGSTGVQDSDPLSQISKKFEIEILYPEGNKLKTLQFSCMAIQI